MNATMPDDTQLDRMRAAADWLVRLNDAPEDDAVVGGWLEWCEADAENMQAFQQTQNLWRAAAPMQVESASVDSRRDAYSSGTLFKDKPHRKRLVWSSRSSLALAASITAVIGVMAWTVLQRTDDNAAQSYSTPIASLGSSVLPDGSQVELGARSRITTHYSATRRHVTVDAGEAYFTVMKDASRPFTVSAGNVQVTALGTAFNVRRGEDRVVVAVSDGKVQIAGAHAAIKIGQNKGPDPVRIGAGQQGVYIGASRKVAVAAIQPGDTASWRHGVLKYLHEPLSGVVADLNRYSSHRIEINDAHLGEMPFTGTVFSARIDDALRAFEDVFPMEVIRRGEVIELKLKD